MYWNLHGYNLGSLTTFYLSIGVDLISTSTQVEFSVTRHTSTFTRVFLTGYWITFQNYFSQRWLKILNQYHLWYYFIDRFTGIFTRTWLRYIRVFAITNPSVCRLSSSCSILRGLKLFGNISLPVCYLATLWPPCKVLRKSSKGNPCVRGIKLNRGSKVER